MLSADCFLFTSLVPCQGRRYVYINLGPRGKFRSPFLNQNNSSTNGVLDCSIIQTATNTVSYEIFEQLGKKVFRILLDYSFPNFLLDLATLSLLGFDLHRMDTFLSEKASLKDL